MTLVLLPGLDGSGGLFEDFEAALPPALNPIIGKYPPDCFMPYSALLPLVQELTPKAEPFVLLAESFSCPLAVMCAANCSPNLAGLILCAGFVSNPMGARSLMVRALARRWVFRLPTPDPVLNYFLVGANASPALKQAVRQAVRRVSPDVLARRVRAVLDTDAREELSRTEIPLLYIRAEDDVLVRRKCFEEIQRLRPDTILETIPGPHLLLQREPQRVAEIVGNFVVGLTPSRTSISN